MFLSPSLVALVIHAASFVAAALFGAALILLDSYSLMLRLASDPLGLLGLVLMVVGAAAVAGVVIVTGELANG